MSYATLKRITMTCGVAVVAAILAGKLIEYRFERELLGASLGTVASIVSAVPLCVVAVFLVVQAIPGGRSVVPMPGTKSDDTWLMLLLACLFVPLLEIREFVPAGQWGNTSEQVLAGVAVVTLTAFVRKVQIWRGATGVSRSVIVTGRTAPSAH